MHVILFWPQKLCFDQIEPGSSMWWLQSGMKCGNLFLEVVLTKPRKVNIVVIWLLDLGFAFWMSDIPTPKRYAWNLGLEFTKYFFFIFPSGTTEFGYCDQKY